MVERIVEAVLLLLGFYALAGVVFAACFHWRGVASLDRGAAGAGWFFRALITPGIIALWPLLAARWRRAVRGGGFQGDANSPVTAGQLRARHLLSWKLLAVLIPLLIAAALYWRPAPPDAQSSKIKVQSTREGPNSKRLSHRGSAPLNFGRWNLPEPLTVDL
jgi:hypothetical protein